MTRPGTVLDLQTLLLNWTYSNCGYTPGQPVDQL